MISIGCRCSPRARHPCYRRAPPTSWFVFGTAGDTILPFLACLGEHPIKFIQLRNEESAAYAASAYAKLTGELGVVIGDGGPGTGRLINGLADALSDGAPVLAVTGQVESIYLGTGHKQYINQQQLLGAVTLRSENLGSPRSLPTLASDLLRTAVFQGGPVHLSIPKDFWQQAIAAPLAKPEPFLHQTAQSPEAVLDQAAQWLAQLERPMILAGRGARRAVEQVLALAEKLGAGVIYTLPMVGVMPDHPLVVRGIGKGGSEAAVELLKRCDGLLKLGATYWLPELTADEHKVLALDIHPANLSRGIPADFGVVGDAQAVLAKLLARLDGVGTKQSWIDQVKEQAAAWRRRLEQELQHAAPGHPGRAIRILSAKSQASSVFCLDVGDHVLWFSRFFQGRGQEVLISGCWRGMGFSLGAGIAAQLARADAQVFSVVGDGGFSMLMGEFVSAVELQLPIIFVLMNNRSYAMEASAMAAAGLKTIGVALRDIRFDQVAQACGGVGLRLAPPEPEAALEQVPQRGKPLLIDLQVDPVELPTAHL
ncbi:MAG TPA: hypothetical protein DCQ17_07865 [Firmicutes bacterium]|nr:hypothetical protein [Bacillota bacterium]